MTLILSGTDGLSDIDGSAATPAIRGTDTNTGIFFPSADTIAFSEGGTESMRIDSSGNVGVGTSSPATKLDVNGPASVTSFTGSTKLGVTVRGSTAATDYSGIDLIGNSQTVPVARIAVLTTGGGSSLSLGTSNNYGTGITNTAMTINPTGNVGIGTSSPAQALEVLRTSNPTINITETSGSSTAKLAFLGAATLERGELSLNFSTAEMRLAAGVSGNTYFQTFYTNGSERARIDSSGNTYFGSNQNYSTGAVTRIYGSAVSGYARMDFNKYDSGTFGTVQFYHRNGNVGAINVSDTATAYATSSDYRLKHDITPMTGALAKVAALKPVTYKWNTDNSAGEGFIAHELAEVVPQCVTGEKDAVETYTDEEGNEQTRPAYQGIDTSFLVATLTAAIQEQQAIIQSLTARIEALEGK